ncbi:MAG TPA: hypothetical protein VH502_09600 [Actinoplanes sp.]
MSARTARILAGVTAAAGIAVLTGPRAMAVVAGLLLGFVLPGLALTAALFRGRVLMLVERSVLAPALSLAVLVVAGLVAYVAGLRLDRPVWTAATVGVTLCALLVPGVPLPRRQGPPVVPLLAGERRSTGGSLPPLRVTRPLPVRRLARQLMPMAVVVAMLGGAAWLSLSSARRGYDVTVTALSAAPPGAVDAAGQRSVAVRATGLVPADGPYALVVSAPDGTATERRTVVPTGSSWTGRLTVGADRTTVGLYRAGDTTAYRTVYIAAVQ